MSHELTPPLAQARLQADPALTLVDIRTVGEFAQGRPFGHVINVPVAFAHPTTGERIPNKDFAHIVRTVLGEVGSVLVSGTDDSRSAEAARLLEDAGMTDVGIVIGGMDAWRAGLLSTTRDNRDGVSYVSLLMKVRRPDAKPKAAHAAH